MYDLHLSEEQLAIRDTVCDFVTTEIAPVARLPERLEPFDPPLPLELVDRGAALGLRTLALSEAAGGADADTLTCCLVAEELGVGDVDVASVLMETAALGGTVFGRLMDDAQCARFLPALLDDSGYHLALALGESDTETALGVNYHRPREGAAPFVTTAMPTADGDWVINGAKSRIANAPLAKLLVVVAATEATETGTALLLVPSDAPGLSVQEIERDGGWYHGSCGDVAFSDCRVPAENLLTADDAGLVHGLAGSPVANAINLGVARAAFEAALDYAKLRVQGSRPIVEHQAIGEKLAGIAVSLETARAIIWQAAWAADHPDAVTDGSLADLPHATIAQVATGEMLHRAAQDAAECFGAMGVMRDMPMQKYIHDTRLALHSGNGANDAKLGIAEIIAGYSS
ncbi:MAG: hypothetical protein GKS02_05565 [Alphaproteobacteria bacterium]|nr:hypothetical protein [Alphaproteobacteria bacterium]